jgi:acyl-CoA synthetase (AMP-forming)/AMP-acid ligase II
VLRPTIGSVNLMTLLDMAASAGGDRVAFRSASGEVTYEGLRRHAAAGASRLSGSSHLAYVGTNDVALPSCVFAAAWAGVPFLPLNYRLGAEQIGSLLAGHEATLVVADEQSAPLIEALGQRVVPRQEWRSLAGFAAGGPSGESPGPSGEGPGPWDDDPSGPAVLLYTSGTTSAPKAVVLRHRHLTSYVLGSVEFASADPADTALVSVPPYHIAGVAAVLSNLYALRRVVYLEAFDPESWLRTVREEGVTTAMVVPTMLARLVEHLGHGRAAATPTLRSLAYGGARMPPVVLERALRAFPGTDFVNAYGLTETSSTIAVLGPDDHRRALDPADNVGRQRLTSVGRLLPGVEVEIRDNDGRVLQSGSEGEVFVRGEQVSGEYLSGGSRLDAAGWFATRDRGWVDGEGYLFLAGRSDDTIIRGGENVAPAEVEDALLGHPAIAEAVVVGVPDDEWGERLAAVVVLRPGTSATADEIRSFARSHLRSSKTPDQIEFWGSLPLTDTGKVVRRKVLEGLLAGPEA